MDTNTQIERLIELAIVQRTELKRLVEELPQLKEHLSAEIERTFEETEPQLRAELEEWTSKQAADKTAALGVALESKIASLAKSLEESAQAKFSAVLAARDQNADLLKQAEERIAVAASEIPGKVKEIVTAELARFPRAGEIEQLRKEFAEPRGLNPRGKWLPDQTYNKLDLVTWNGDSYVSNTDGNKERPGRNAANWTLSAARGTSGGGPADLSALTAVPSNGELLIGSGTSWVNGSLSAGAGISITVGPGAITISATDGDITLDDGTAASPSLHFTNDPDTGIYRPAANTLGISVSGTQVAYFDENGLTVPSAGVVAGGSFHGANGNANNPSYSFSGDQDTGFFRHQPNEIGIALGGTQKATLTSTTFTITPNLVVSGTGSINGTTIPASKTLVVTTDKLSALASTSSSELAGVITDETGTGALVFANTPTLVTPNIGAATGTSFNLTGSGTLGTTLAVNGTTDSSSKDTGAIVTEGGLGVEKSATIGGNLTVSGTGDSSFAIDNFHFLALDSGNLRIRSNGYLSSQVNVGTILASNAYYNTNWTGTGTGTFLYLGVSGGAEQSKIYLGGTSSGSPTVKFTLDTSSGAATLAGNLTVSGTGLSSVAGAMKVGGTATFTGAGLELQYVAGGGNYGYFRNYNRTSSVYERLYVDGFLTILNSDSGGNVLIGTTTDSSNGKLQLATHTTSAGGIGFGTDTPLYRYGAGFLAIDHAGAANSGLFLYENGVIKSEFTSYGGATYLGSKAGNTIIQSNNTTALTLDSSQNAEFKGGISGSSNRTSFTSLYIKSTGASSAGPRFEGTSDPNFAISLKNTGTGGHEWQILTTSGGTGIAADGSFALRDDTAGTNPFIIAPTTGNATFAGTIAIGNTVNTVSPTSPNRTITMVIGGTTYYIHAKTTND